MPNSKTQIVTKPKLWENSKIQILTKRKKSNCDKTQTSNGEKLKSLTPHNSISEITLKINIFWQEQLDTSTTDEMYSVQRFAILQCFTWNSLPYYWHFPSNTTGGNTAAQVQLHQHMWLLLQVLQATIGLWSCTVFTSIHKAEIPAMPEEENLVLGKPLKKIESLTAERGGVSVGWWW